MTAIRWGRTFTALLCLLTIAAAMAGGSDENTEGYSSKFTGQVPFCVDTAQAMVARQPFFAPPAGIREVPNVLKGMFQGRQGAKFYAPPDPADQFHAGSYFPGAWENGWTPSDAQVAVGPNHVVACVNGMISVHTKSTGAQLFWVDPVNFFSGFPVALASPFDPRCFYDQYSGRFFINYPVMAADGSRSYFAVACSATNDPTGTWYKWLLDSTNNGSQAGTNWSDYPGMGYTSDAITWTANMYPISSGSFYGKARVAAKAQFLSGSSSIAYTDFWNFGLSSMQPGRHFGTAVMPIIAAMGNSNVRIVGIQNAAGSNPTITNTRNANGVQSWGGASGGVQPFTTAKVDTLDGRIYDVNVRDNRALVSHNIGGAGGSQVRWYEVNVSTLPSSVSLVQQGNIITSNACTYYGALQKNANGDIGTGITESSTTEFVSLYSTGRASGDPAGTTRTPVRMKASTLSYGSAGNTERWGDYLAGAIDPSDDLTFWAIGMVPGSSGWWTTEIYSYSINSVTGTTPTTLTESNVTGQIGQTITQSVTLTKTSDGTLLNGKTVNFTISGTATGTGTTDASGVAAATFTIPMTDLGAQLLMNATWAGDATYRGTVGGAILTVAAADTTTTAANKTGAVGSPVSLSATLKRNFDNLPLALKTISFSVDGISAGSANTNTNGTATKSFTVPDSLGAGPHTITASFAGTSQYNASTGTGTLTVLPADTTTTPLPASGMFGQTVSLSAVLTRNFDGAAMAGRTLTFSIAGSQVGTGVTDSSGTATCSYVVSDTLAAGANTLTASFAGESAYSGSSGDATFTANKANTATTAGNATGTQGGTAALTATLKRTTDNGVLSGKSIAFTVDGNAAGSGTTDGTGTASVTYSIPSGMVAGPHTIGASFGGDSKYNASSGSGTLTVNQAPYAVVSGAIDLQNIVDPTGQTSTMEFRAPGTTNVLYSAAVTLDGAGNYSASGVPFGTYDIAVKFSNWLRQVLPSVAVTSPAVGGQSFSLVNGDANGDNGVNLLDLSTVLSNFGWSGTPPMDGDVTWSGTVDLLDLSTVLSSFGATGAP